MTAQPDRPTSVIVAGARTPMGRLLGSLKGFSGADLGGFAIKGALEKAGVSPEQVDYVIMGQVLQAGAGQIPARQAAVKAGIPMTVPALTINKVCLSGINAIAMADQLIRAGEFDIVVAGGQESMTNAPHLLDEVPRGLQVRRRHRARPHGLRRPLGRLHRPGDGPAHRGRQHRRAGLHPRGAGRVLRPQPPAAPPRPGRTASSTTRSCPSRSRSARATRSSSRPTRASAPTPRPTRSASCARRSPRTAPSRPAPPRRSPTAPPRSSS